MERREAGQHRGREAAQVLGLLTGAWTCVVLAVAFAMGTSHQTAGSRRFCSNERINPNVASWSSLSRLPGVGVTRARAIVVFRDRIRSRKGRGEVFRCADDLALVKGIGPATIETIRPWLEFGPAPVAGLAGQRPVEEIPLED